MRYKGEKKSRNLETGAKRSQFKQLVHDVLTSYIAEKVTTTMQEYKFQSNAVMETHDLSSSDKITLFSVSKKYH